jgi:hypothetical protein
MQSDFTLRFTYQGPGRCRARHDRFTARVETVGPYRRPYRATLSVDREVIVSADFENATRAQAFLRAELVTAITGVTTFELCHFASEKDLEHAFARRAAIYAKRHRLSVLGHEEVRVLVDGQAAIARRYKAVRLGARTHAAAAAETAEVV